MDIFEKKGCMHSRSYLFNNPLIHCMDVRRISSHLLIFREHWVGAILYFSSRLNRWRLCLSPPFVQSGSESALMGGGGACGSPSAHWAGDCQSRVALPGRRNEKTQSSWSSWSPSCIGDLPTVAHTWLSCSLHVLLVKYPWSDMDLCGTKKKYLQSEKCWVLDVHATQAYGLGTHANTQNTACNNGIVLGVKVQTKTH